MRKTVCESDLEFVLHLHQACSEHIGNVIDKKQVVVFVVPLSFACIYGDNFDP